MEWKKDMGCAPLVSTWGWGSLVHKSLFTGDDELMDPHDLKIRCQLIYTI